MDYEKMKDEELRAEMRKRDWPMIPLTATNKKLMIKKLKNTSEEIGKSLIPDENNSGKLSTSLEKDQACEKSNLNNKIEENSRIITSPAIDENQDSFIGINSGEGNTPIVFRTVKQALSFIKSSPASRFKCFKSFEEAESFSKSPPISFLESSSVFPKDPDPTNSFPSVKPQQLNHFKSLIKDNNISEITKILDHNPKYLITSLDAPTIIHEGFHRNSLHVAAFLNKPDVVLLILSYIKNIFWISKFYNIENPVSFNAGMDKSNRILELFLNSPEKSCLESPLHIAAKYGFYEIVKILRNEPLIDISMKNSFNETARDIICNRYSSEDLENQRDRIKELFENNFWVILSPDFNMNVVTCITNKPSLFYDNCIGILGPTTEKIAVKIENAIKNVCICDNFNLYLRSLGNKFKCSFLEYFKFLGCFINFSENYSLGILDKFLEFQNNNYDTLDISKIESSFNQDSFVDQFNSLSFHSVSLNIENSMNITNFGFLTIYSVFYSKWNDPLLESYLKTVFRGMEISKNNYPNLASFINDRSYL